MGSRAQKPLITAGAPYVHRKRPFDLDCVYASSRDSGGLHMTDGDLVAGDPSSHSTDRVQPADDGQDTLL